MRVHKQAKSPFWVNRFVCGERVSVCVQQDRCVGQVHAVVPLLS